MSREMVGPIVNLGLAALLAIATAAGAQEEKRLPARTEKKIITLIRKSVSRDEKEASRAQESLIDIGVAAIPFLHHALDEERERSYTLLYVLNRIYQKEAGREWEDIPARKAAEKREGHRFLERKFGEAKKAHEEGDHERALRILEAILTLGPEIDFREAVEALKQKVETGLYHATVLSASFETDRASFEAGEVIEVSVRIRNPGKQAISIPMRRQGENIGAVHLERWAYLPAGNWEREYQTEALPLPEEIRLEPGETYDLPYLIDTRGLDLPRGSYVALWLTGELRPPSVIRGVENRARLIEVPRRQISLLPVGQASLAEDPVEKLRADFEEDRTLSSEMAGLGDDQAQRKKEIRQRLAAISEEVLPLAFLTAREGLWEANRILVGSLDEASPACADTAMKTLSLLNGKALTLEKHQWQIWWFKVR